MLRENLVWLAVAVLPASALARSVSAADLVLGARAVKATISAERGALTGFSDEAGRPVLIESEDRYDLDGRVATEAEDRVLTRKIGKNKVSFECVNEKLGLRLFKEYRLNGAVLEKETRYLGTRKDPLLLKVSSRSGLDPARHRDGYYYLSTDDGWKVFGVPFTPGAGVTEPKAWTLSTGSFVYYFPKEDRVFAHYRYKVDGRYFYSEVHPSVESKFLPGGALTGLGLGFVNDTAGLTLESRYVLIPGDPRDYHRYLLNQLPYTEFRTRKVPGWFPGARMFLSDPGAGMVGLMTRRDAVLADVADFVKLLKDDEYLMVFFNHWTVQGDFPYEGTFRYYTYTDAGYSRPVPIEELKQNLKMVKAISPRIKVGGYALFIPTAGTPPYDEHKDWLLHDRDGKIEFGGDGTGLGGLPDFSSGYRDYVLNQMNHYLTDLGFDWIHIDFSVSEGVNWRTGKVVQSYDNARLYEDMGRIFEKHNAALVQNFASSVALWAHGSYMECQQPDRWEKKDWRILAVPGSLGVLWRTYRPGVWVNLCYGTRGIYGIRNAQTGMRGWIRNALNWWRDVSHSLAHEKVIDELLTMSASDVRVYPSWWKLQTDKLEVESLNRGGALVIPLLWHGDQASEQEISLDAAELAGRPGNCLFALDFRLSSTDALDAFAPVPWRTDYLEATAFEVLPDVPERYVRRMRMEPLRNYYHVVSRVPAWVYTAGGARTSFLLPDNQGVSITGSLPANASAYRLAVQNDRGTAQIMAYLPDAWKGAKTEVNGRLVTPRLMTMLGRRFLLLDVGPGKSAIRLSSAPENSTAVRLTATYENPYSEVWRESSRRLFYQNLTYRAYQETGRSCLVLKEVTPGGGGSVGFHMGGKEEAGGFSIAVKGGKSGGRAVVSMSAGDTWSYEIKDDFAGWREFNIRREEMTCNTTVKRWEATTYLTLCVYPAANGEMCFADIHLLPAREGDIVKAVEIKRKATIYKTGTPPVIDGYGNDACWKDCEVITDFMLYNTNKPAASKAFVRLCYDDDNLYMLFDNLEPIVALETAKVPEAKVWLSDHCHLFLDPYRDTVNYFEIGIDTAGTVADIKNSETGWDMKWNGVYEVKTGLNYNVGWMCEMRIPFSTLGRKPKTGDVWGVTFMRADNTGEASVWTTGHWNDPAGFGDLIFGGEKK